MMIGEESPNTTGQGALRNRGFCGQYPAGTESVTEKIHLSVFDGEKR